MRRRINQLLLYSIAGTILFFSVFAPPSSPSTGGGFSFMHLIAYFGLAGALSLHLHDTRKGHLEAFALATLFGLGMEILQLFIPGRFFSLHDIAANTAGSALIMLDLRGQIVSRVVELEDRILEKGVHLHAEHF